MWDVWWTKWLWDRYVSEFFGFTLSISFHHGSPYSYIIWGMNNIELHTHTHQLIEELSKFYFK
jgi:hypothetical protein